MRKNKNNPPAPDPFDASTSRVFEKTKDKDGGCERPVNLGRDHTWYPHPEAIRVAVARLRYMDVDDNIDRYLMKCAERQRSPSSNEWLKWYLEDDAAATREDRRNSTGPDTHWNGFTRNWGDVNHLLNAKPFHRLNRRDTPK